MVALGYSVAARNIKLKGGNGERTNWQATKIYSLKIALRKENSYGYQKKYKTRSKPHM